MFNTVLVKSCQLYRWREGEERCHASRSKNLFTLHIGEGPLRPHLTKAKAFEPIPDATATSRAFVSITFLALSDLPSRFIRANMISFRAFVSLLVHTSRAAQHNTTQTPGYHGGQEIRGDAPGRTTAQQRYRRQYKERPQQGLDIVWGIARGSVGAWEHGKPKQKARNHKSSRLRHDRSHQSAEMRINTVYPYTQFSSSRENATECPRTLSNPDSAIDDQNLKLPSSLSSTLHSIHAAARRREHEGEEETVRSSSGHVPHHLRNSILEQTTVRLWNTWLRFYPIPCHLVLLG